MKKTLTLKSIVLLSVLALSGCSMLVPYENEFSCKRPNNTGKCISTEGAYEEMTTGISKAPYAVPASKKGDDTDSNSGNGGEISTEKNTRNSGYDMYLDANYKETAKLIDEGITPILTKGDTIKIVLVPNRVTDKMLLSERSMYIIIKEPEFVMGNYLTKKHIPIVSLFGDK